MPPVGLFFRGVIVGVRITRCSLRWLVRGVFQVATERVKTYLRELISAGSAALRRKQRRPSTSRISGSRNNRQQTRDKRCVSLQRSRNMADSNSVNISTHPPSKRMRLGTRSCADAGEKCAAYLSPILGYVANAPCMVHCVLRSSLVEDKMDCRYKNMVLRIA
jgi:hypothetical protein